MLLCYAVVCCAVSQQTAGIDEVDAAQEQQQAAAAAAVQLPWLGPILQTALAPMQVGPYAQQSAQLGMHSCVTFHVPAHGTQPAGKACRLMLRMVAELGEPAGNKWQERQNHNAAFCCLGVAGRYHRP